MLEWIDNDERVRTARELVRKERQPEIDSIKAKIEELRKLRPAKSSRWPENIPADVLEFCKKYWSGTTEYRTFRIGLWNDDFVWTSYPSGGYSDNGGWHPTPAVHYLLSRKELRWYKPVQVASVEGRLSKKVAKEMLDNAPEALKKNIEQWKPHINT